MGEVAPALSGRIRAMKAARMRPGADSTEEFRMSIRVYYEDTDAGGVVYYANYLKFCERARTEWLRELGFSQQALMDSLGIVFVVRSISADYLRPAGLDEELEVRSSIGRVGGASMLFTQRIVRDASTLFEAHVTVACVDWHKKKAAPIPAPLRQRLARPT